MVTFNIIEMFVFGSLGVYISHLTTARCQSDHLTCQRPLAVRHNDRD